MVVNHPHGYNYWGIIQNHSSLQPVSDSFTKADSYTAILQAPVGSHFSWHVTRHELVDVRSPAEQVVTLHRSAVQSG